jgi:aminomethyltransferase
LIERLGEREVVPCGLGARDTLRLEAGLLLAGQDFDSGTNPYQVGLDWAISWNHDFKGRPALEVAGPEPTRGLVGFTLPGRLIPRHGYRLRVGPSVGEVTSGNFSPMLDCGIGLGYLSPPYREGQLEVEIRGAWEPAQVVEPPFYRR